MDTDLLELFWETVKEYVPVKDRQTAADHVVGELVDFGLDDEGANMLKSLDTYMRHAILEHFPEDDDQDDDGWEE